MDVFLAVGSNLGDARGNILQALALLGATAGIRVKGTSPVYETPAALLYATARDADNKPYLNCSVNIDTTLSAFDLLKELKRIEKEMGRDMSRRWSPRPVDLDIIFYGDERIETPDLTVPHPRYRDRSFVLDPLSWFKSFPADILYKPTHQPLIAGILNVTPDSFSDGGTYNSAQAFAKTFEVWEQAGVQIIDIGAQSTRPNAPDVSVEEELNRLAFVFDFLKDRKRTVFSPKLSIDTKHAATARKALENGFDIINDVDGLDDPEMVDAVADFPECRTVVMHHADISSVPFERVVDTVRGALEDKLDALDKKGISGNRIWTDIGIGFNKTATQSLCLLQNIAAFHLRGVKTLVGHSRKSFMGVFTKEPPQNRDAETLAISVGLFSQTDVLRVHTPVEHLRALAAVGHLNNQFFSL